MSATQEILLNHLQKTSRSFYLGIVQLKGPLQIEICLGYLLCRIFDCFEDATSVDPHLRKEKLQLLSRLVESLNNENLVPDEFQRSVLEWHQNLELDQKWVGFSTAHNRDYELLLASPLVLNEIAALKSNKRKVFAQTLIPMANGMIEEIHNRQILKNTQARNLNEFYEYCYWVAGTVGDFLTQLFLIEGIFNRNTMSPPELTEAGRLFGRALQIVNIAKDFYKDWDEGRCFWPMVELPSSEKSEKPKRLEIEKSFDLLLEEFERIRPFVERYLGSISKEKSDVKFFCAFPYKMAIETLKQGNTQRDWLDQGTEFKLNRIKTLAIMASVQ